MSYQESVLDLFREHQMNNGMDETEVEDLIEETSFSKIEAG